MGEYRYCLRPMRELYGSTPAADFSPLILKAVRQRMIEGGGGCGLVNRRVCRVVHLYQMSSE